ncbi:MAG: LPS export ABC transporter periplasmic protein LptC [Bacteroidia bacterium]|nr:LPS export ABC transporter periplasmic protein LptC [Bacteroidia bacterium]MBT8230475.1 LPS export ABC transporter periplasmic protein LptC [Bacteroidia bacterium]NNK90203.1 LPS export ABC transporter periplasmic protein LptC [Saprospiraceae bacterium]
MILLCSCGNNISDVNRLIPDKNAKVEIAKNVEILYSDSAIVKVRIKSDEMRRYMHRGESYDEFPNGIYVEFLDKRKKPKSWLEADYAIRKDAEKKIFVKENVVLYNTRDDKLETDELVWDEESEEIYTTKPVKITQPAVGDTSFGFGFKADQEFSRFEIKRKFSGIKNIDELTKDLK